MQPRTKEELDLLDLEGFAENTDATKHKPAASTTDDDFVFLDEDDLEDNDECYVNITHGEKAFPFTGCQTKSSGWMISRNGGTTTSKTSTFLLNGAVSALIQAEKVRKYCTPEQISLRGVRRRAEESRKAEERRRRALAEQNDDKNYEKKRETLR